MSIYDNAGVVLIPSGYKAASTDNLYSVLPANGNGDFNATRGSTATRVNKDGLIESVATNVPRLNYPLIDGVVQDCPALLLEPSRTNIIPRSEDIDTGWSKSDVSITNNNTISPDGFQNAAKITENTNTSAHVIYDTLTGSVSPSITCYFSCFIKKGTKRYIQLREGYSNTQANIDTNTFTLANSSNLTDYEIENYGNEWHRISFKFTSNSSGNIQFACYLLDDSQNTSYTGDGTSYVYLWGAQIEAGSYATSYIPTSGETSGVTRSADVCNGSGTSAEFNDSEGILFTEISALANDSTFRFITISDGTTSNRVTIFFRDDNTLDGGVEGATFFDSSVDILDFNRVAVKYKSGDSSFFVNGFKVDSNTDTFTNTGLNQLDFDLSNGSLPFYGKTKQLMTFKTALTDSELETLTSWDSFNAMATGQLYTIE